MSVQHDLYCRWCGAERHDVMVNPDVLPLCISCGRPMRVSWSRGKVPSTDIYGSEQTSRVLSDEHGNDLSYTSTRERDRAMAKLGCVPAGDPVGGARAETYRPGAKSYLLGSVGSKEGSKRTAHQARSR